jgi:sec-independent protein translocase protein TatA
MGGLSITHWLIILAIIFLLFGADRLPKVMRSLGRGVVEFKKGVAGIEDETTDSVAKKEEPKEKITEEQSIKK